MPVHAQMAGRVGRHVGHDAVLHVARREEEVAGRILPRRARLGGDPAAAGVLEIVPRAFVRDAVAVAELRAAGAHHVRRHARPRDARPVDRRSPCSRRRRRRRTARRAGCRARALRGSGSASRRSATRSRRRRGRSTNGNTITLGSRSSARASASVPSLPPRADVVVVDHDVGQRRGGDRRVGVERGFLAAVVAAALARRRFEHEAALGDAVRVGAGRRAFGGQEPAHVVEVEAVGDVLDEHDALAGAAVGDGVRHRAEARRLVPVAAKVRERRPRVGQPRDASRRPRRARRARSRPGRSAARRARARCACRRSTSASARRTAAPPGRCAAARPRRGRRRRPRRRCRPRP